MENVVAVQADVDADDGMCREKGNGFLAGEPLRTGAPGLATAQETQRQRAMRAAVNKAKAP